MKRFRNAFLALFGLAMLLCLCSAFVSAEGETYTLVTDTFQLTSGDNVILVSDDGSSIVHR